MMTRLEKKCFMGSAGLHGMLLIVFFFSSAFFKPEKPEPPIRVIQLYGAIPTDQRVSTGGSPKGNPTPPAPAPTPPQPVAPQPPPPKPPETVKAKEPEKVDPPKKDVATVPTPKPAKPPEKPKDDASRLSKADLTKTVTRTNGPTAAQLEARNEARKAKERADREHAAAVRSAEIQRQRIADALNGVVGGLGSSLSKETVVEALGDGGVAYLHYGTLVGEKYRQAVYQSRPQGDEDVEACIQTIVSRNGAVISSEWVRKTGNPALDKAVDRAMREVRTLPPFPEGAKDAQRTFKIRIGFEARRYSG
jgi:TonB family protein